MSKFNDEKTDAMLKAYFTREQEAFVYKKHSRQILRNTSLIAAALVLLICGGFISSRYFNTEELFTFTADAATADESVVFNPNNTNNSNAEIRTGVNGFIMFESEGIVHAKVRSDESVKGNVNFARFLENSTAFDFKNEKIAIDYKNSTRYNLTDAQDFYYWDAETDWTSTQWIIYSNFEKAEDTIEVVLYYADGTYSVHCINVTFNGDEPVFELAE